jgi:signal transduction histidine kinase
MRRRLIRSTLSVVFAVVVVFGVPLGWLSANYLENREQEELDRVAEQIARAVSVREGAAEDSTVPANLLRDVSTRERSGVVQLPNGALSQPVGAEDLGANPFDAQAVGSNGEVITIQQSREATDSVIRQLWLAIGGVALLALAFAFVLAWFESRRLSRPLTDLANTAARLGSGDPRPLRRRYGIRELDQVSGVLDDSVTRVAEMLASERRFATDASHQLRTPLTALSMRLEEILVTDDAETINEEATAAIAQVERLADVVDRLLAEARQSRTAHAVSLHVDVIVRQQVTEWNPAFAREGRRLTIEGKRSVIGLASPGGLSQVLATLLENSLAHGAGTTSVRIRTTATKVVIEVSDQGPGVPSELSGRIFERSVSGDAGTGLGLAVARDLAEADGGRLDLIQAQPPIFAVFLTRPLAPDLEEPDHRSDLAEMLQRSSRRERSGRSRLTRAGRAARAARGASRGRRVPPIPWDRGVPPGP